MVFADAIEISRPSVLLLSARHEPFMLPAHRLLCSFSVTAREPARAISADAVHLPRPLK